MPIIISEVEIAVEVSGARQGASSGEDALSKEDIIKECVEKVMEIINLKNER